MSFDINQLVIVVEPMISGLLAICFACLWIHDRRQQHVLLFASALAAETIRLEITTTGSALWRLGVVVLEALTVLCLVGGTLERAKRRVSLWTYVLLLFGVMLAAIRCTDAMFQRNGRNVAVDSVLAIILWLAVARVSQSPEVRTLKQFTSECGLLRVYCFLCNVPYSPRCLRLPGST